VLLREPRSGGIPPAPGFSRGNRLPKTDKAP